MTDHRRRDDVPFAPRALAATAALALAAATQALACSQGAPPAPAPALGERPAEGAEALAASVEAEAQAAFNDAACYCEAYLVKPASSSGDPTPEWAANVPGDACAGDPRLAGYVAKYTPAQRQAGSCFDPIASPSPPPSPPRAAAADERVRNGCWDPSPLDGSGQAPSPGFCRADFNYCLGQQLRLKADSLARPPSSVAARAKVLEEARVRFAMAGAEFASALERVDAACSPAQGCYEYLGQQSGTDVETWEVTTECTEVCDRQAGVRGAGEGESLRPQPICPDPPCIPDPQCHEVCVTAPKPNQAKAWCSSLGPQKVAELRAQTPDAFDHLVSATSALASGGGVYSCTVSYSAPTFRDDGVVARERVRVQDGYGETAATRLADAVSQAADLGAAEARERAATSDALAPVAPTFVADLWGPGGQRALAARALFGDRAPRPGSLPPLPRRPQRDDGPRRALELLETYRVPMPYQLCPAPGAWEALDDAGAGAWAAGAYGALGQKLAQQLGRPAAEGPALLSSEHGVELAHVRAALDLARDRLEQLDVDHSFAPADGATCGRGVLRFHSKAALQREPAALAAAYADGAAAGPSCALEGPRPSAAALRAAGAAGAIDYVRERTRALSRRQSLRPWASSDGVRAALREAEGFVGAAWAESDRCGGAPCPGPTATTTWTLWGDVASAPPSVVVVRSEAELSCLRRGHLPGAPPGSGCPALPEFPLAAVTRDGVAGRTFALGNAGFGPDDRALVAGKSCAAGSCSYRLLDAFYPAAPKGRHALGGRLLDEAARLLAHDPANPALAAYNSLGVENGFVPPLQNALDGSGHVEAEAHVRYLRDARQAAESAAAELSAARQVEIDYLVSRRAVNLATDAAELAQRDVLTAACGNTSPTCAVARAPATKLGALGLVPAPGPEPAGYGPHATCTEFLTLASFALPDDETSDYVAGFVGAALRCTRWATLLVASEARLEGLPRRVIDELAAGGTGNFPDQGGEVRQLFIELFQRLQDVRAKARAFDTAYRVAEARLQSAALLIDDADPSWFEEISCAVGRSLKVAGALAATAAAVVAVTAATGPAGAGIALAELTTVGAGLTSLGTGVETLGSIDECFDNSGAQAAALGAWAQALESMEAMRGLSDESVRLIGGIASVDNRLDRVEADAALAAERAALEARLAQNDVHGDPAWRAMQGRRVESARRKLRDAQRLAFAARRAVEFRTASDLRWLTDPEYVGGAPASWAGEPFVAHQAYLGTEGAVSAAGERVVDFVEALEAFVDQYPVAHEFAVGTDRTVLNLRGALGTTGPAVDALLFKCRDYPDPLPGGRAPGAPPGAAPCASLGGAQSAQASFVLPSTLSGYYAGRFALGNKNYRVQRVAVNLRGAGLFDCALAPSPSECVTDRTVRYNLRQDGLVALESLDGERRFYGLRDGVITGARGLANEAVLNDPPDADDAAIVPYERQELRGRPLAGAYAVTIAARPELVWANLEDVQLLVYYEYWTPQR